VKLAADIGGTFTDLVYLDGRTGELGLAKAASTPPGFERGVMDAIAKSGLDAAGLEHYVHGATLIISDAGGSITATFGRHKYRPWGVAGGRDGSPNAVQIRFADGREPLTVGKTARYPFATEDVAHLITGTGGGWGDPRQRDRASVLADPRAELVTEEVGRRAHGLTDEDLARV
jgi:hypothetical protein